MQSYRFPIIVAFAVMLGSCSYRYDLKVVAIDGRLAFIVDPHSRYKPHCIDSIHVSVDEGGPLARPSGGDDERLVRNGGVYWWEDFQVGSCQNPFPIFYGQPLKGARFIYQNGSPSSVKAKPLRIGVVYEVDMSGDGASAQAWFRITRDGRVENLRDDPMPPVLNDEGYDVTDYANLPAPEDEGTYFPSR